MKTTHRAYAGANQQISLLARAMTDHALQRALRTALRDAWLFANEVERRHGMRVIAKERGFDEPHFGSGSPTDTYLETP